VGLWFAIGKVSIWWYALKYIHLRNHEVVDIKYGKAVCRYSGVLIVYYVQ